METDLSPRQAEMLRMIEAYVRRAGMPPTIREIAAAVGLKAPSHVLYHLRQLHEKGAIVLEDNTARGIRLSRQPGVPVRGEIAAGAPLAIFEPGADETLDVDAHVRAQPEQYALRVRGDSMIDDRIYDGDYILVQPAKTARDGQIVVAVHLRDGGELGAATVKRWYAEKQTRRIRLQPANPAIEPRYISLREWNREWEIQGVVTAVYRPLGR